MAQTRGRLTRLAAFDAFVIPAGVFAALILLIATGALGLVSKGALALLMYGLIGLFCVTLVRGFLKYRKPTTDLIRDKLDETDPHRPLAAMKDSPAKYSADTKTYWQAHRKFLQLRIDQLKVPDLTGDWKKRDPAYLRFIVPALLVLAIGLNFKAMPTRLEQAASADLGALFGADDLQVSAWLTPPEHTGEAPVYLTSTAGDIKVPAGSTLTFRVHGSGTPKLKRKALGEEKLDGPKTIKLRKYVDGANQAEFKVFASQSISLHYWGKRGSWNVETAPDGKPTITFATLPAMDENDKLSFDWKAEDDYGVAKVFLKLTTLPDTGVEAGLTDLIPLDLPTAFQQSAEDTARLDLVRHKWAGLDVGMSLHVEDTAGQTADSEPVTHKLPEKLFLEPVAKSSQEIRVTLLREYKSYGKLDPASIKSGVYNGLGDRLGMAPDGVQRAALMLDAVTYKPQIFMRDYAIYLGLKRAHETIRGATSLEELSPLDDLLWSVTMRAEYGTLADAARRLAAARRALEQALRNGASEEEIRRLMKAFREAVEDFIAARMAEALTNGQDAPGGGGQGGQIGGQDLEDMLSALQQLTETGASDAARKLLSDVSNLLNTLQFQKGGSGSGGMPGEPGEPGEEDKNASDEEKALQGALDKLADLLENQRKLNDDTVQERFGVQQPKQQGGSGPSPDAQPKEGQGGDGGEGGDQQGDQVGPGGKQSEESLAERQGKILQDLESFAEGLGEDSGEGTGMTAQQLERARRALGRAQNALERGDFDAAQWNQDRAIQDLRDAAGDIAGKLDERKAARLGENGQDTNDLTDPLGRPNTGTRNGEGENIEIPDKVDRQRARDILDTLRKRLENSQDEDEREYLKRLLDRFGS